jgi:bifunctional UDP-N-acetylglucosamine pyrophosphorylase/glucosamine-1-phosphate N-acetyltransferase
LISVRQRLENPAVVVLGFRPSDVGEYGRLIVDDNGLLQKIVEAKDASSDELNQPLCNSGIMAIDAIQLPLLLDQLNNDNAKGEYYLTDIVELAVSEGRTCAVLEGDENEVMGINSKVDLAEAEGVLQNIFRQRAMKAGVTLQDPSTVYFSWDTNLGRNVSIGPNVYFGQGVTVGDDVVIHPYSHLEGTKVSSGAVIGPFARLRPGTDIGRGAHIGNFVEIKNSVISNGAKANHLSYIGDAKVGQKANIGAGTITCNYDGQKKSMTEIGAGAFIGSNTSLVAPVKVGVGAVTGAGSVITKDVEDDALAVTRGSQNVFPGWASRRQKSKGNN